MDGQDHELDALLSRTAAGDSVAFRSFYDATVGRCYGMVLSLQLSRNAAEDCVADVYAQVWRTVARFDAAKGSAIGWLMLICRTRAIDQLRHERVERAVVVGADAAAAQVSDEFDGFGSWLGSARLRGALAMLGREERRLVALAYLHEQSHSQIAAATGLPLGTVKSRLRRALRILRKELGVDEATT
jgi:RNA polymerase sigma-70 factor (ECF subfamily)